MSSLTIFIDGGSRGNPGDSGYGIHIVDEKGQTQAEIYGYLGRQTNNFAEYHGLLEALKYARKVKPEKVTILSDSELLVRQIRGIYRVKSPTLKPLHAQAMSMIANLPNFKIRHIPREQNAEADRLANEAMTTHQTAIKTTEVQSAQKS